MAYTIATGAATCIHYYATSDTMAIAADAGCRHDYAYYASAAYEAPQACHYIYYATDADADAADATPPHRLRRATMMPCRLMMIRDFSTYTY